MADSATERRRPHDGALVPCRRPGCGTPAAVAVSYDAERCEVRVHDVSPAVSGAQPLCGAHVARLHAPQGWVVLDRRLAGGKVAGEPVGGEPLGEAFGGPFGGTAAVVEAARAPRTAPTPVPLSRQRAFRRPWGGFDTPRAVFERRPVAGPGTAVDVMDPLGAPRLEPVHMTAGFAELLREPRRPRIEPPPVDRDATSASFPQSPPSQSPPSQAPHRLRPEDGPVITWAEHRSAVAAVEVLVPEIVDADIEIPEAVVLAPLAGPAAPEPAAPEPAAPERTALAPAPSAPEQAAPQADRPPRPPRVPRETAAADPGDVPLLKPKGRMLSRAFGATGHQRSVLTEPLGASSAGAPEPSAPQPSAPRPAPDPGASGPGAPRDADPEH